MNVIVVGCGRMGAELALALARGGEKVTIVDRDRRAFARLRAPWRELRGGDGGGDRL